MSVRSYLYSKGFPLSKFSIKKDLEYLHSTRRGVATGNSAFDSDADISTPIKAIKFFPKGLTYFLFAPFPWRTEGLLQKITIPETILWYTIFPFILYGIYIYRVKWREFFAIIFFVTITLSAYSLLDSNIGTAYRHKATILPFLFVFAGAGISKFMENKKRRLHEKE